MKKILLTLIISATIGIVHAQNVNIPDAIFKAVLVGNSAINTNGDSEIQVSEATAFGGTIFCASLGISDLTGIEAFTALTVLNCSSNLITSLDVSQNTALTSLNCSGDGYAQGQITNLDVSLNTALTEFYCFENQLDNLNISQNSALTTLWCYENQLDSLNVSQNPALTTLWCSNNQLSSLDLNQNTSLGDLNCAFNQLTYLDLANGNNTNLNNFHANNNPNLFCVDVDDVAWSTNNWTNIGAQTYFSTNCSFVAFDCTDSLEVTDVIIDNGALTMNIAIYNGYNSYLSMPYVAFTIDANGDTIQQGNMNSFGVINLDTSWYNYSISGAINPSYPLTMYFVYVVSIGGSVTDTCILTYDSTPTVITDVDLMGDRKLISIVDVLGRETKGTKNEPLFYLYDDGTVEKKIIIE